MLSTAVKSRFQECSRLYQHRVLSIHTACQNTNLLKDSVVLSSLNEGVIGLKSTQEPLDATYYIADNMEHYAYKVLTVFLSLS